ncbi:MAG: hypothetical protein KA998_00675 [Rickettsiaceae bacterium]|nr:hypothetical protein [Rickettsiaceae bacterium]
MTIESDIFKAFSDKDEMAHIVQYLLEQEEVKLNFESDNADSLLFRAIREKAYDIAEIIIDRANVDIYNINYRSSVEEAAGSGHLRIFEKLINKLPSVSVLDINYETTFRELVNKANFNQWRDILEVLTKKFPLDLYISLDQNDPFAMSMRDYISKLLAQPNIESIVSVDLPLFLDDVLRMDNTEVLRSLLERPDINITSNNIAIFEKLRSIHFIIASGQGDFLSYDAPSDYSYMDPMEIAPKSLLREIAITADKLLLEINAQSHIRDSVLTNSFFESITTELWGCGQERIRNKLINAGSIGLAYKFKESFEQINNMLELFYQNHTDFSVAGIHNINPILAREIEVMESYGEMMGRPKLFVGWDLVAKTSISCHNALMLFNDLFGKKVNEWVDVLDNPFSSIREKLYQHFTNELRTHKNTQGEKDILIEKFGEGAERCIDAFLEYKKAYYENITSPEFSKDVFDKYEDLSYLQKITNEVIGGLEGDFIMAIEMLGYNIPALLQSGEVKLDDLLLEIGDELVSSYYSDPCHIEDLNNPGNFLSRLTIDQIAEAITRSPNLSGQLHDCFSLGFRSEELYKFWWGAHNAGHDIMPECWPHDVQPLGVEEMKLDHPL